MFHPLGSVYCLFQPSFLSDLFLSYCILCTFVSCLQFFWEQSRIKKKKKTTKFSKAQWPWLFFFKHSECHFKVGVPGKAALRLLLSPPGSLSSWRTEAPCVRATGFRGNTSNLHLPANTFPSPKPSPQLPSGCWQEATGPQEPVKGKSINKLARFHS